MFEEAIHAAMITEEDGVEGCVCVVGLHEECLDMCLKMSGIEVFEG